MISVQEAENIILQQSLYAQKTDSSLDFEEVPLVQSLGRILAENLVADRDFPPFDRITMDGIAIRFEEFKGGTRIFRILGVQAAGMPQLALDGQNTCIEVMTGAVLPRGCDTVVRYEDLKIEGQAATILVENIAYQQNIHQKGIDRKAAEALILRGSKMTAAEIATAATIGKSKIRVVKLPQIAIISTGDELVDVYEIPLLHQIRRSNVYALSAMLESELGIKSDMYHLKDDAIFIQLALSDILGQYDVVLLSGAVSEGKFDYVPKALEAIGVQKLFHKVAQRPGKPFWFGVLSQQSVIFALPGNPVSTFLCAYRYVLPFLRQQLHQKQANPEKAVLSETITFKPDLTYFLPVRLLNTEGVLVAYPLAGHGSGDLANLNDADGFVELPQGRDIFEEGEAFFLIRYRS